MKFFLNRDVRGLYSRKLYGRRGDEVVIIAEHDNMLIIEVNGSRWPVLRIAVSGEADVVAPPVEEEKKAAPEPEPVLTRQPTKKGRSSRPAPVSNTQTLF